MKIIGCDFHPSFQQIAMLDTETGELVERKLLHPEEAIRFYESLAGEEVLVGLESMGNTLWLERLLSRLGFALRIGDRLAMVRGLQTLKGFLTHSPRRLPQPTAESLPD